MTRALDLVNTFTVWWPRIYLVCAPLLVVVLARELWVERRCRSLPHLRPPREVGEDTIDTVPELGLPPLTAADAAAFRDGFDDWVRSLTDQTT